MIRLAEVRARIEARVPALAGNLRNAGDWARVVEQQMLPEFSPAAFLLPGGFVGGKADVATGLFRQSYQETVSIVLVVRVAGDPLGEAAIDEITPLVRAVVEAVAGCSPDDAPGAFVLERGELVGAKDGALLFHIDFSLHAQLRILNP